MFEHRDFMFNRRGRWPALLAFAQSQSAARAAGFFDLPAISANRSDRLNMSLFNRRSRGDKKTRRPTRSAKQARAGILN